MSGAEIDWSNRACMDCGGPSRLHYPPGMLFNAPDGGWLCDACREKRQDARFEALLNGDLDRFARLMDRTWDATMQEKALRFGSPYRYVSKTEVIRRDKGICQLCGQKVPGHEHMVEHRIPLRDGGVHSMANVRLVHARCHNRGDAKPLPPPIDWLKVGLRIRHRLYGLGTITALGRFLGDCQVEFDPPNQDKSGHFGFFVGMVEALDDDAQKAD